MAKEKLMIMGGTGFLGYHTALLALEKGFDVASISLDDIDLEGWYPKEIKTHFVDVFKASEDELANLMKGYDYMVYSIGPDDRDTPKAPSYDFFHQHLVIDCAKCFRAARKAGVKKAVVFNSYFAYFDEIYPQLKLSTYHPYIRARVEQAQILNAEKENMEVVVLQLPYIFGSMPKRTPLWKQTFLDRFAYGKKTIFFPKGTTTMTAVSHIAEAAIGALLYGEDGKCYPIGDENRTYNWMLDTMMEHALGKKRKIINPPAFLCAMGAKSIVKKEKKMGNEPGLDLVRVMKEIMSSDEIVVPNNVMDEVNNLLHVSRGGLKEAIEETMDACYPNHSFK